MTPLCDAIGNLLGEIFERGFSDVRVDQKEPISRCISALPEDARELVFE